MKTASAARHFSWLLFPVEFEIHRIASLCKIFSPVHSSADCLLPIVCRHCCF